MTSVLLEPHPDDAALFAAFTCYANKPLVVTVLRADVQDRRGTGITADARQNENDGAMMILGCDWEQWPFSESAPDWAAIDGCVYDLAQRFDHCYAPLPEVAGHPHHNAVGQAADAHFGDITFYTTYTRTDGRTRGPTEVAPSPGALAAKLSALSCYTSQIDEPSTRPWFFGPFQEWHA